jgi:hypothetical protein
MPMTRRTIVPAMALMASAPAALAGGLGAAVGGSIGQSVPKSAF